MSPVLPYYFIPVHISTGMFSNEYSVKLDLSTGESLSFFADKSLIKKIGEKNYLRVNLVDKQKNLVLLPVEPFEGSRWAEVSEVIPA